MGAEQSTSNSAAKVTAEMFMCGNTIDSCRTTVVPKQVKKLILEDRIYREESFHGPMLKVMQTIHKARACVFSNFINFDVDTGRVTMKLHEGRTNETMVPFDKLEFAKFVERCDKSILGVPISFRGHANMLIINKVQKTLEHFEPHGVEASHASPAENTKFKTMIHDTFLCDDCVFSDYTYVPPEASCPIVAIGTGRMKIGMQGVFNTAKATSRAAGTCVMWSLWYLHVRLTHPELAPSDVMTQALSMAFDASTIPADKRLSKAYQNMSECEKKTLFNPKACNDQAVQSSCASHCKAFTALAEGGQTMEDFIINFTQRIIAHMDLDIYKMACVETDHKTEGEGGSIKTCYRLPPRSDDAFFVIYTSSLELATKWHAMFKFRSHRHPTLDYIVFYEKDEKDVTFLLDVKDQRNGLVKMYAEYGMIAYVNNEAQVPSATASGTVEDKFTDMLLKLLKQYAPMLVEMPIQTGYMYYMVNFDEADDHVFDILENYEVEEGSLDPSIYDDTDKVYARMPEKDAEDVKTNTTGAAFYKGTYLGTGIDSIVKHAADPAAYQGNYMKRHRRSTRKRKTRRKTRPRIYTGPRGGRYYVTNTGTRVYL